MLGEFRISVADGDLTLVQHWTDNSCCLEQFISYNDYFVSLDLDHGLVIPSVPQMVLKNPTETGNAIQDSDSNALWAVGKIQIWSCK